MKRKVVNPDPVKKKVRQAKEKLLEQDLQKELDQPIIPSKKIRKNK